MNAKFDGGQLRGAYSAGFEAGARHGTERMRREGWRRAKDGEVLIEGEIVKALVPTIGGWIGLGRVLFADTRGVCLAKLDCLTGDADHDAMQRADFCLHEVARKVHEDF